MKKFKIITIFPEFFQSVFQYGLLGKAIENGSIQVELVNLRDYSDDRFGRCDDYTYGGGSGMIIKPEPLAKALDAVTTEKTRVALTAASGRVWDQNSVKDYTSFEEICIICGRYEGIDQRIVDLYVDDEISVGDYVLSGGEYAALIMIDTIARYEPGFMSNPESLVDESFENFLLEYPQYTRPAVFRDLSVPEVLLSGNHQEIARWRTEKSIEKTKRVRPELYKQYRKSKNLGDE